MFLRTRKKDATSHITNKKIAPSVIASDVNILGNVVSDGVVDVDGVIQGNLKCRVATLRENGKVRGDLVADVANVWGEVDGVVKAKTVNLFHTAKVHGVVMHESISVEDGAQVDGKFKRMDNVFLDRPDMMVPDLLEDHGDPNSGSSAEIYDLERMRLLG